MIRRTGRAVGGLEPALPMPTFTSRTPPRSALVVGAGVGGLVAACVLQRGGVRTTLVERRHVGGCATTFPLAGLEFDAGATLAFGLDHPGLTGGVLDDLGISLPHHRAEIAWEVHGEGYSVRRWVDRERWLTEAATAFGPGIEPFWTACERVTDVVLRAALRRPPLPPTRALDYLRMAASTSPQRALALAPLVARPFRHLLRRFGLEGGAFERFCDLQLLITAQVRTERAMSLYAALALALPHTGTAVLKGGMGALAARLAERFRDLGGELLEEQEVTAVDGRVATLASGRTIAADAIVLNLTPWDAERLLGELPRRHARRLARQPRAWGALCCYLGLPDDGLPAGGRHIQLEAPPGSPLGERQSVFVSVAGGERTSSAGVRPATVSVHAQRDAWPARGTAYDERKAAAQEAVLALLRPHLPEPSTVITATPKTWIDFAGRDGGRVGGFPAVAGMPPPLPFPPRLAPRVWLVGDSVLPGQSTMAVALAGRTIARAVLSGR